MLTSLDMMQNHFMYLYKRKYIASFQEMTDEMCEDSTYIFLLSACYMSSSMKIKQLYEYNFR